MNELSPMERWMAHADAMSKATFMGQYLFNRALSAKDGLSAELALKEAEKAWEALMRVRVFGRLPL